MEQMMLVRLASELTLKAPRTRSQFMRRLLGNMRDAFVTHGASARIRSEWGRVYVRADSAAATVLSRVFGLSSYSMVDAVVPADLPAIVERGYQVFGDLVRGKRFAVRAHRAGTHDFTSKDVERALGARLRLVVPAAAQRRTFRQTPVQRRHRRGRRIAGLRRLQSRGDNQLGLL